MVIVSTFQYAGNLEMDQKVSEGGVVTCITLCEKIGDFVKILIGKFLGMFLEKLHYIMV